MEPLSFMERLKKLFDIILSSPFFLALLVIVVLTVVILIINHKIKDKLVRIISAVGYACIIVFIFIKYGSSVVSLFDNLVDSVFTTIYFPNLVSYICMMVVALLLLIRTIINNKLSIVVKISNISVFVILMFLLVLTLDIIVSSSVNIYNKVEIYSNETLTVLIQSSTMVFFIWVFLVLANLLVNYIVNRQNKKKEVVLSNKSGLVIKEYFDKISEEKKLDEAFEEVDKEEFNFGTVLSEIGFKKIFNKKKAKQKYEEEIEKL